MIFYSSNDDFYFFLHVTKKSKLNHVFFCLVENRMHNPALRLNLKGMLNKDVMIKIRVYKVYLSGKLIAFDQYSNILLENAVEYKLNEEGVKEEICKYSGNVLLRGDSIIALTIEK